VAHTVINIKCPNCKASVDTGQAKCAYCNQPVTISTFNSVFEMPMPMVNQYAGAYRQALSENPEDKTLNVSVAFCCLKLKLYEKALNAFEKALEDNFDNSELFFYAAICLLNGKKAFLSTKSTIDKVEEYIQAALAIEPKGIYYYLWTYIKYDYYFRKCYNTSPTHKELFETSKKAGLSPLDVEQLYGVLGVERPAEI